MKATIQLDQVDLSSFTNLWQEFINFLPKLVTVILVVLIGWLLIKLLSFFISKALKVSKIDALGEKLKEIDLFKDVEIKPASIIVKVVKWVLYLFLIVIASDILGLDKVSDGIASFIGYLPKLFSAIAILILGIYLANIVKNSIQSTFKSLDIGGSKIIGNIVFFAITIFVAITALNQAGINTEIITNNLTIILGALLLAFTIAFGLGSKEVVQRLLFGFYSRKNLAVGQRIKIDATEGIIDTIDNINLVLKNKEGKFMYPIKEVNDKIIQIFDEE